ncbi:hypothetical protein [Leifsonia sp. Root112D2]|uniref:hypothetical protein n=1 Tax=Leifsonia sp. Root112D2 TaxID=1736426 RepID=UPI0006F6E5F3|nr:hypothetical protein [Leifsonia sp. Root112D2]KQV05252.1 hypothetical protein ASC63_15890 [Leifsonia sp. Root112D2]
MVAPFRARHRVRAAAVLAAVATVTLLASCSAEPAPSPSPSQTQSHSETPSASTQPTPSSTPTATPTPVTLTCDQVITPQQLYTYNSNVGANPSYTATEGSLEARAVAAKGVACGWLNQSSNETMQFAVAKPTPALLNERADAAVTSSTPVPTYGAPPSVEGYFSVAGNKGEVQVFTNGYWIVGTSSWFLEPGDAATLVANIIANLPKS